MTYELEMPTFAVIPYAILSSKIPPNAKLLYGCLAGLSRKSGYCWATNEQLAEMFSVGLSPLKKWLTCLEEKGFIRRETENKPYRDSEKRLLWKKERKIYLEMGNAGSKIDSKSDKTKKDLIADRSEKDPIADRSEKDPIADRSEMGPVIRQSSKKKKSNDKRSSAEPSMGLPDKSGNCSFHTKERNPPRKLTAEQKSVYERLLCLDPMSTSDSGVMHHVAERWLQQYPLERLEEMCVLYEQDRPRYLSRGQKIASVGAYIQGSLNKKRTALSLAFNDNKQAWETKGEKHFRGIFGQAFDRECSVSEKFISFPSLAKEVPFDLPKGQFWDIVNSNLQSCYQGGG